VCGDLTSVFRPYNGEKITLPQFLERDEFIEGIHKAQFRQLPSNYKKLTGEEITVINKDRWSSPLMPQQEKGIRDACALPYELNADAAIDVAYRNTINIALQARNKIFGKQAAGSPFQVYAIGLQNKQAPPSRAYAVTPGDTIYDTWLLSDFENGRYHLQVYGPNGFFNEFIGDHNDPLGVEILCECEFDAKDRTRPTGNVLLRLANTLLKPGDPSRQVEFEIIDNAYKAAAQKITLPSTSQPIKYQYFPVNTAKSFGWYDFSVKIKGNSEFERRYAGRVETGYPTKTDPFMGRVV
jgi:phospholipase C